MNQSITSISNQPSWLKSGQMTGSFRKEINIQFEIHTLEWMRENRSYFDETATQLNWFEIIWVRKGTGSIIIDMTVTEIENEMVYCLAPGQLRHFRVKKSLQGYYISLSPEFLYLTENQNDFSFLPLAFSSGKLLPVILIDPEMQKEMEEIVNKMIKEFSNYYMQRSELLKGLFKIFMIYLLRKIDLHNQNICFDRDTELVNNFMLLLKKHFTTKKMVADYAQELNVTPNYLNRVVKKISGYTASYHIQQYIILEAKRKAIYSDLSMKEVAYFLGFNDYAHFSKFFKNNSGMNFTYFKNVMALDNGNRI